MNQSESINELASSLAKAQGSIQGALKDSKNPHFKSNYADLASVWEACRKPLSENSLSISQIPATREGKHMLTTMLMHSSGQWIRSEMELPIQKPGPQELGSCLSYCRRYALASMVGIYQTDDDGNLAQRAAPESATVSIEGGNVNHIQVATIKSWLKTFPNTEDSLLRQYECENIEEIPSSAFDKIITGYKKLYAAKKQQESKEENPV